MFPDIGRSEVENAAKGFSGDWDAGAVGCCEPVSLPRESGASTWMFLHGLDLAGLLVEGLEAPDSSGLICSMLQECDCSILGRIPEEGLEKNWTDYLAAVGPGTFVA